MFTISAETLLELIRGAGAKPKKCHDGYTYRVGIEVDEREFADPECILADVVNEYLVSHSPVGVAQIKPTVGFLISQFVRYPIGRSYRYFWQVEWPSHIPDPEEG